MQCVVYYTACVPHCQTSRNPNTEITCFTKQRTKTPHNAEAVATGDRRCRRAADGNQAKLRRLAEQAARQELEHTCSKARMFADRAIPAETDMIDNISKSVTAILQLPDTPKGTSAEWGSQTLRQACYREKPESAMCVQNFNDSRGLAIRITYRISLRSSSLWEPRHPPLKVVLD